MSSLLRATSPVSFPHSSPLVLLISHVKEDRIKSPSSINTSQPCISDQCLPVCRIIHYYTLHYGLIASEASFLVCSMRGFSIYLYIYIFIYIFIYIYIYIFQAVRRAVNEMFETPDTVFNNLELFETPDTVFNNLELLVNPSSTAKKCPASTDCRSVTEGKRRPSSTSYNCSLTDDCDRIDGRETNPSSTAKKCSATEDCCRNPGGDRGPSSTVKYCSATGLLSNRIAAESTEGREARLKQLKTAKHFQVYMSVRSVSIQAAQSLNVFDVHVTSTVPSCTPLLAT